MEKSDARRQNILQKERLQTYNKNKHIRQFIATYQKSDHESIYEDDCVGGAVEDITAHFIQIDSSNDVFLTNSVDADEVCTTFSHIATTQNELVPAFFTSKIQNISFSHPVMQIFQCFVLKQNFMALWLMLRKQE